MKDILNSLKGSILNRLSSTVYGSIIIAWIVANWEALYITFFVKEDLIFGLYNKLKIEYICDLYSSFPLWRRVIMVFGAPILWTLFRILVFPYIDEWAYRLNIKSKVRKEKSRLRIRKAFLTDKEDVLQKEIETTELEKDANKQKEEKWREDIDRLSELEYYGGIMKSLQSLIYENFGWFDDDGNMIITSRERAFLDVNGFVTTYGDEVRRLRLTDKGRFALREYMNRSS